MALSDYALGVAAEVLIFALFAASLHLLMSVGGLASFGHAAYFGLGSYGAALATKTLGLPMAPAILAGIAMGASGALLFGWFCVRNSGVYSAMLTLAFAEVAWSIAYQWTAVTGGDNGIVGVWPDAWAARPSHFFWLTFAVTVASAAALRMLTFSPFGYALRALRDNEARAGAIGLARQRLQWAGFVASGAFAALAGALFAFLKGGVFPDNLGLGLSVDGLVMVLIGGVDTLLGGIVGAVVFRTFSIWTISHTDHSRLVVGALIVALVMLFPEGLVGAFGSLASRFRPSR
jgi:branched-chain amino acid transport system permease protein